MRLVAIASANLKFEITFFPCLPDAELFFLKTVLSSSTLEQGVLEDAAFCCRGILREDILLGLLYLPFIAVLSSLN